MGSRRSATLTTALAGTNNDLTYNAQAKGLSGNSIRVRYVVAGASTPLTVSVSSNDITVNVATSAGSAATSTANDVKAAVKASAPATALVSVTGAATSVAPDDGTGVVTALSFTNLANGTDWTVGR